MFILSYFYNNFFDTFSNHSTLSSRFIQEIEHALGLGLAKQCPLREFLTVYIKNIFLHQVLAEINKEIEGVTKTSDPLKILANADTMKVLGVQRPLLQVTIYFELTVFISSFHCLGKSHKLGAGGGSGGERRRRITHLSPYHQGQNKK